MNVMLNIKNADNNLLKAIKSVINLYPTAKLKIEKEPSERLKRAISQAKKGEVTKYKSFEALKKDLMK